MTLMLLASPGGKARRYEITQRHVLLAAGSWLIVMALFFYLGFTA